MTELHARVREWVSEGADTELPRDLAIHAFSCDECLALASGLDALHAIDVGAATEPAAIAAGRPAQPTSLRVARAAAGLATIGLLVTAIVVGTDVLRPTPLDVARGPGSQPPAPSIVGGVLGGVPETQSPAPSEAAAAEASAAMTATPEPSAAPDPVGPAPVPPPPPPAPPAGTPRPTAAATVAPATVAPTSAVPTPAPTPVPTRVPTATPAPTVAPTPIPTPPPPSEPAP